MAVNRSVNSKTMAEMARAVRVKLNENGRGKPDVQMNLVGKGQTESCRFCFETGEIYSGAFEGNGHVCHICGQILHGNVLEHLVKEHDSGRTWYQPSWPMQQAIATYICGADEDDIAEFLGGDVTVFADILF